jgi:hypothetical protein
VVPFAAALLWSVGAAIVAAIVIEVAIGAANPRTSPVKDVRGSRRCSWRWPGGSGSGSPT